MIFLTVGAQMPFDRLVRAVDAWAGREQRTDVFAQIGPTLFAPRHIQHTQFMNPTQFQDCVDMADAIIAHAGMGTIITAVEHRKPILVMPRQGDLGETRNDHQVATAREFQRRGLVRMAMDEVELAAQLEAIERWRVEGLCVAPATEQHGPSLLHALQAFIGNEFVARPDLMASRGPVAALISDRS